MDNPEKLATQGTQDEDKQNKNTTQYVLDSTMHKQTQITLRLYLILIFIITCLFNSDDLLIALCI